MPGCGWGGRTGQVVGLVTKLDATRFALFHMEQRAGWEWRWRIAGGGLPASYLDWRPVQAGRAGVIHVQPERPGCRVEAEWRAFGEEAWGQATLLRLLAGRARFRLEARDEAVELAHGEHELYAPVRHDGVGRYLWTGGLALAPGEGVEVEALADTGALANVLFAAGEFRSWDRRLRVVNTGPSEGSWEEDSGEAVLTQAEWSRPRLWSQGPTED